VAVSLVGALNGVVIVRGRVAPFLGERIAAVARNRAAGAVIAALLDPALQRLDRGRPWLVLDGRRLCNRVRLDSENAGSSPEHLLDDRLLARIVKAADVQDCRRCPALVRHQVHSHLVIVETQNARGHPRRRIAARAIVLDEPVRSGVLGGVRVLPFVAVTEGVDSGAPEKTFDVSLSGLRR
jgi:hypothetical protein